MRQRILFSVISGLFASSISAQVIAQSVAPDSKQTQQTSNQGESRRQEITIRYRLAMDR